jgi:hypothetical protein
VAGSIVKKRMEFLFSFFMFAFNMFNPSPIAAAVIQAFLLFLQITGKLLMFRFLIHLGFAAFPIPHHISTQKH